jgi:hypothetical protein
MEPRHARVVEIRKPSSFGVSVILLAEIWVLYDELVSHIPVSLVWCGWVDML